MTQKKSNALIDPFVYITQNLVIKNSVLSDATYEQGCSFMNNEQNSLMRDINITNTIVHHVAGVYCKECPSANHFFFQYG